METPAVLMNGDTHDEVLMACDQWADDEAAFKAIDRCRRQLRLFIGRHIEGRSGAGVDDLRQQVFPEYHVCRRSCTRGNPGPGIAFLQDRRAAVVRLSAAGRGREADSRLTERLHYDCAADLAADPGFARTEVAARSILLSRPTQGRPPRGSFPEYPLQVSSGSAVYLVKNSQDRKNHRQ